ncbi:hypothetical protein [Acidovorax sp. NCPPB 3576]|uniref:hypothetical protein n=1 Tax=Acidovorax sp. NCPPB 3576 TaxID=2940488 RepID=UPI00234A6C80|nr:hypothetical protein [Acidovorax sp. NCPPB 3576]WCM87150.1 hypothetical protein M5C98_17510 [Acidovorax sp. NCPPB 3576]
MASQLYDPGVIDAERLRVNQEMMMQAPPDGHRYRPNRTAIEETVQRNMAARADANNLPRDEVSRRLERSPELQAELARLSQKLGGLANGRLAYRRAELVHIASANLALRARNEASASSAGARTGRTPGRTAPGPLARPQMQGRPEGVRAEPRADLRTAISSSPPLQWSMASQLYDPDVIAAERLRVSDEMILQASPDGNAFVLNRDDIDAAVQRNMAARADANNLPRDEVARRLNGSPELQAEVERLFQKMDGLRSGPLAYRRAELVHIASENLAARGRQRTQQAPGAFPEPQPESTPAPLYQPQRRQRSTSPQTARPGPSSDGAGPSQGQDASRRPGKEAVPPEPSSEASAPPVAGGWRGATSRRTRPAPTVESVASPVQASPARAAEPSSPTGASSAAGDGPRLTRSSQFQGRRFNAEYVAVRPQGSAEPADAAAGSGRRVRFAEYAVREGIAERTDGSKGKPARLPRELRDASLSEIGEQIRRNQILQSQGMLPPDDEEEVETSAPAGADNGQAAGPLTLESFGFSLDDDENSDAISDDRVDQDEAMEISDEDRSTIAAAASMFAPPGVGR